jgi:hypothetical protein
MPTSSPGPCPAVPVGHSPASSFMGQTGMKMIMHVLSNVMMMSVAYSINISFLKVFGSIKKDQKLTFRTIC